MKIVSFLTNQENEIPALSSIRQVHLEGWFYSKVPKNHHIYGDLHKATLVHIARHALIKQHLTKLVYAWHTVGIVPLLIKGFGLAEFVYEFPYQRYYSDVDILILPSQVALAMQVAREQSWTEFSSLENNVGVFRHEYGRLISSDGLTIIDVHTEIIQSGRPDIRRKNFSEEIYAAAETKSFGNGEVKIPTPTDAAILMLQNRRFGDHWARKPSDYLDL